MGLIGAVVVVLCLAIGLPLALAAQSNPGTRVTVSPPPTTSRPIGQPTTAPPTTPTPATAGPTTTASPGVPLTSVHWSSVAYPIAVPDCHGFTPPVVVVQVAYPVPAPSVHLAAVMVRCNVGAGTPWVAFYIYDRAIGVTTPHLAATLLGRTDDWQASAFTVHGPDLSMTVDGFSSTSVANCCPDVHTTLVWQWTGGAAYKLVSAVPPHV